MLYLQPKEKKKNKRVGFNTEQGNMDIRKIKPYLNKIKFSSHAKEEMLYDEFGVIYENEIKEAIYNGEIIEEYPKDRPYPSCLIFGQTGKGRPLHVVCAVVREENMLVVITVYQPNPELWVDYRRRKL